MEEPVRIGELARLTGRTVSWLRRAADRGEIPSIRTTGGHRRFIVPEVLAAVAAPSQASGTERVLGQRALQPAAHPDIRQRLALDGLEEDAAWRSIATTLHIGRSTPAERILQYAFTEMLNNAIDHSGGTNADVSLWRTSDSWTFRVTDDGEGAFPHLRARLGLPDDLAAIQELTKGKRTTMPERHSGEGIFFTSKAVDVFQLSSAGLRWTVDNLRSDHALGVTVRVPGTAVLATISHRTTRDLQQVFAQYTNDSEFVSTRPVIKLFAIDTSFVSRSEAKRVLSGLDDFTEVVLDFGGVSDVGQGFVDEVFRVWPLHNPGKRVDAVNMNPAVTFMVNRARRRGSEPPYGIEP